jgi:hypothetical protein
MLGWEIVIFMSRLLRRRPEKKGGGRMRETLYSSEKAIHVYDITFIRAHACSMFIPSHQTKHGALHTKRAPLPTVFRREHDLYRH